MKPIGALKIKLKKASKLSFLPLFLFCAQTFFMSPVYWELGSWQRKSRVLLYGPITVLSLLPWPLRDTCPMKVKTPSVKCGAKNSITSATPSRNKHIRKCDQLYIILASAEVSNYTEKNIWTMFWVVNDCPMIWTIFSAWTWSKLHFFPQTTWMQSLWKMYLPLIGEKTSNVQSWVRHHSLNYTLEAGINIKLLKNVN